MIVCVLGSDSRQKEVANIFKSENYNVYQESDCVKNDFLISKADVLVLPLPFSRDKKHISNSAFSLEQLKDLMKKDCLVFAGMCKGTFENEYDYNTDEEFLRANAFYTAEGAVSLAIKHTDFSLSESKVLIIGNGRIGKSLAKLLKNFGAKITVSARKEKDFLYIKNHSNFSIHTNLARDLSEYDIVFNTVPKDALMPKAKQTIRSDALIIDLASAKSGLYREQNYIDAKGLPSVFCAKTSAKALYNSVKKYKGENLI